MVEPWSRVPAQGRCRLSRPFRSGTFARESLHAARSGVSFSMKRSSRRVSPRFAIEISRAGPAANSWNRERRAMRSRKSMPRPSHGRSRRRRFRASSGVDGIAATADQLHRDHDGRQLGPDSLRQAILMSNMPAGHSRRTIDHRFRHPRLDVARPRRAGPGLRSDHPDLEDHPEQPVAGDHPSGHHRRLHPGGNSRSRSATRARRGLRSSPSPATRRAGHSP